MIDRDGLTVNALADAFEAGAGSVTAHALVGALHTASGLTTGHVLTALSASTFGFAAPSWSGTLSALGDVTLASLANGDMLHYDGGAAVWKNRTPAQVLSDLAAMPLAGGTFSGPIALSTPLAWAYLSKTSSSLADLATRSASDLATGTLALARGGSGADLSASGGAGYVVRQNSAAAAFTVSALTAADITAGTFPGASYIMSGTLKIQTVGGVSDASSPLYLNATSSYTGIAINAPTGQDVFLEFMQNAAKTGGISLLGSNGSMDFQVATTSRFNISSATITGSLPLTLGTNALTCGALTATTGAFANGSSSYALTATTTGAVQARFAYNGSHYLDLGVSGGDTLVLGGSVSTVNLGASATASLTMGALTTGGDSYLNGTMHRLRMGTDLNARWSVNAGRAYVSMSNDAFGALIPLDLNASEFVFNSGPVSMGALTATTGLFNDPSGQAIQIGNVAGKLRLQGQSGTKFAILGTDNNYAALDMGALTATTGDFSGRIRSTQTLASGPSSGTTDAFGRFVLYDDGYSATYWTYNTGAESFFKFTGTTHWRAVTPGAPYAEGSEAMTLTTSGALTLTNDLSLSTLGTFDHTSTPALDYLLRYNGTKWVASQVQLGVSSGVAFGSTLGDGTTVALFNTSPTLSGTPVTPAGAPGTELHYHAVAVDMSATGLPANCVYVLDYSVNGASYSSGAIISTSPRIVHSNLDPAKTYAYKYLIRGGSDSSYSTATGALSPGTSTVNAAFGLIAASQIAVQNLAAISADIGTILAGRLQDALSGPKTGVLLSGSWIGGTPSVAYLDFTATGANPVLKHDVFTLNADGTATFGGAIDLLMPRLSPPLVDAYQQFHTPSLAHGMTGLAGTDVSGLITYQSSTSGGLNIVGFNLGAAMYLDPALVLQGISGYAPDATTANASSFAVIDIEGWKKSGTGRTQLTGTDNLLVVRRGGVGYANLVLKASGSLYLIDGSSNVFASFVSGAFGLTPAGALSLGTPLADAYVASAATWNAKYGSGATPFFVRAWLSVGSSIPAVADNGSAQIGVEDTGGGTRRLWVAYNDGSNTYHGYLNLT